MGKKSAAETVAENLNRLMTDAGLSNVSLERKLARRVTKSTIGRIRNAENSSGIGNIEEVAKAFGLDAWQMLIAGVSIDQRPSISGDAPQPAHGSLSSAQEELLTLFAQLEPTYQALLIADAKKYLQVQQPTVKSANPKRASAS